MWLDLMHNKGLPAHIDIKVHIVGMLFPQRLNGHLDTFQAAIFVRVNQQSRRSGVQTRKGVKGIYVRNGNCGFG